MDQEIKELLQANIELSRENNKILKKIRGTQKRAVITKILYWIIIIGIAVGAFYFIQPFIQKILDLLPSLSGLKNLPDFSKFNGMLPK